MSMVNDFAFQTSILWWMFKRISNNKENCPLCLWFTLNFNDVNEFLHVSKQTKWILVEKQNFRKRFYGHVMNRLMMMLIFFLRSDFFSFWWIHAVRQVVEMKTPFVMVWMHNTTQLTLSNIRLFFRHSRSVHCAMWFSICYSWNVSKSNIILNVSNTYRTQ